MNTPTARPNHRRLYPANREALRFRAELPVVSAPRPPARAPSPKHDFLVPNPRPDLIADPHTFHMLEAG